MSREEHRIEIGEHTYEVKQLGSLHSDLVFARFMKLAAPALQALEGKEDKPETSLPFGGDTYAVKFDVLFDAVFRTASSAQPAELMWLRDEMLKCTSLVMVGQSASGVEVPVLQPMTKLYDQHFKGRTVDRLKLISFALKVNFADFLGVSMLGIGLVLAGVVRKVELPSNSQKEPDGSSTDSS